MKSNTTVCSRSLNVWKNNIPIREALAKKNMLQWQLADLLGIREETLSRMLRHELPVAKQEEILQIIESTKGE